MKAGVSNIWLLGMIAIFMFLFSCYIIISVNYTKSFKMKNEMLSIIERGKGITGLSGTGGAAGWTSGKHASSTIVPGADIIVDVGSFRTMNLFLLGNAYDAKNYCPDGEDEFVNTVYTDTGGNPSNCWYGVTSLKEDTYEYPADPHTKYYYCCAKYGVPSNKASDGSEQANRYNQYYYRIRLFYKMEFPVLSNWLAVKVDGRTNQINDVQDQSTLPACIDYN